MLLVTMSSSSKSPYQRGTIFPCIVIKIDHRISQKDVEDQESRGRSAVIRHVRNRDEEGVAARTSANMSALVNHTVIGGEPSQPHVRQEQMLSTAKPAIRHLRSPQGSNAD